MSRRQKEPESASRTEDLPSLPTGWCWTTISELAADGSNSIGAGPFGTIFKAHDFRPEGVPIIFLRHVRPGHYSTRKPEFMLRERWETLFRDYSVYGGEVLVTKLGEPPGVAAIYPEGIGAAMVTPDVIRLIPRPGCVSAKYVMHFMNSPVAQRFTSGAAFGTTRLRLTLPLFKEMPVPLAPAEEQRRILESLEELLSNLDAGVAALERVKAKLKRYRASVLKAAVEGKLTEEWRAKHPNAEPAVKLLERILVDRRKKWEVVQLAKFEAAGKEAPKGWREKYEAPGGLETADLPQLPKGWCWATIEQLSQSARYGTGAKTREHETGVPVLRMGNIVEGGLDFSTLKYLPIDHDEFPDLYLQAGDLLFNRTNSAELVGKTAIYRGVPSPCSYASYLIGVRFLGGCNSEFVASYLNSSHGRRWVKSVVVQQVGQANVNGTKLQALAIPLPPIEEQEEIVRGVQERLSNLDSAARSVAADLLRASRLRQSILKQAFEGKLVPQDPNDEPASVLLERIKASASSKPDSPKTTRRKKSPEATA